MYQQARFQPMHVAFIFVLCMCCMSWYSFGQSTLGAINGSVKDPAGEVMPGVHVTLTNTGTGYKRATVTGTNGAFNFRNLSVGTYSVQAQSTGFASQTVTGLVLYANQAVTADMQLKVSGAQNRVEVSAAPSVIDTQNSHLSDVVTGSALLKMPVLTRQDGGIGIYGNMDYMPGVQNARSGNVGNGSGDYSRDPPINGSRQLDSLVTMDGMTVMAYVGDEGGGPVQPSEEAIQELHAVLANAPAEFWRSAAITVVTKTGTNQVHGSLFEDYNGSFLNTKSFFASKIPFRVDNNFAASIGGPIKKNKLFYFADYEGARESAQIAIVANAPLPAWRNGDFSSLNGQQKLINPYTGQAFPNNQIPSSMISPVSKSLQAALFPQPNYGPSGLLSGNFRELVSSNTGFTVFNNGDLTLDYNLGTKDTLFFRESYRQMPIKTFNGRLPSVGHEVESRIGASGVITENHMFSPTLMNELRFGYTDMKLSFYQTFDGYGLLAAAGMQGPFTTIPPIPDVPVITIRSVTGTTGLDSNTIDNDEDYEWNDNLSWTRGHHMLKFGVDQIFDNFRGVSNPGSIYGNYGFNGLFTGNGYADFLLGLPQQTSIISPAPIAEVSGILLGIYAQDHFQVNDRLTLNYGLRWEYQSPYSGAPYLLYSFDPKTGAEVIPTQAGLSRLSPYFPSNVVPVETAAQAGYPSGSLMFSNYLNFYPRMGFAYRLFSKTETVLRGAYGVYGNNVYAAVGTGQLSNGGPFTGSSTFFNKLVNGNPLFSFPKPFLSSGTLATQTAVATDPHITVPYTEQWNLTLEQQLGSDAAVRLSYIGTTSRNLLTYFNLDQPRPSTTPFSISELAYPNYSAVLWLKNGGVDNYNSFQMSVRKTQGRNLFLDTGLTINKDLTDDQEMGNAYGQPPQDSYCLGCEYSHNGLTRRINSYINANYMLPIGSGQYFYSNVNRWQDAIIGGWNLAGTASMTSGRYFSPYIDSGFDTANTNTSFNQRPDLIGNPHVSHPSINNWFNINAYGIPGCPATDPLCNNSTPLNVGRFGNARPRTLVGPNYVTFNFSLMKDFHVASKGVFELRLTSQNVLNHPNFSIPDNYITDGPGVAGVVTGLSNAAGKARETDIFARFDF